MNGPLKCKSFRGPYFFPEFQKTGPLFSFRGQERLPLSIDFGGEEMTAEQRAAVAEYREIGYGYKKISKITGISEGTIKTYCHRNGLSGIRDITTPQSGAFCKECSRPVALIPRKKARQFCSDTCRNRWWNAHRELVKRTAFYEFVCPTCGKHFESYGNSKRKYCSRACAASARKSGGATDGR